MECCGDGFPSGRFFHLHRGTPELCQSDDRVLGHLPDQGPPPLIAQFGQAARSRKSLGGSKLLTFKNDGGHCVLVDLQCFRNVLVPFPRSVRRHNAVSELYRQFLRSHGLVVALTCTVNCGTLYKQVYPIKLLKHLKEYQWKQDAPELNFESHSKGSKYLHK